MADEKKLISVGGGDVENVLEMELNNNVMMNNANLENVLEMELNDNVTMNSEVVDSSKTCGTVKRKGDRHKKVECKFCFQTM